MQVLIQTNVGTVKSPYFDITLFWTRSWSPPHTVGGGEAKDQESHFLFLLDQNLKMMTTRLTWLLQDCASLITPSLNYRNKTPYQFQGTFAYSDWISTRTTGCPHGCCSPPLTPTKPKLRAAVIQQKFGGAHRKPAAAPRRRRSA